MSKLDKEESDRFTISVRKSINKEFKDFLHKKNMKRQAAVQDLIQKWVAEMRLAEQTQDDQGQDAA